MSSSAPVLSCVNTASGVALQWTPVQPTGGPVTYGVFRCDRTSVPGQAGCERFFTTDNPVLVGPVPLGADYIVQAQTSPYVVTASNRLSL